MKKTIAILSLLFLFGQFAQAQFRKPLTSASSKVNSSEALYNIGLSGGLTSTYWLHFGGTETKYTQPFNFGIIGGLSIERMLNNSNSISLEGYYAMLDILKPIHILRYGAYIEGEQKEISTYYPNNNKPGYRYGS